MQNFQYIVYEKDSSWNKINYNKLILLLDNVVHHYRH